MINADSFYVALMAEMCSYDKSSRLILILSFEGGVNSIGKYDVAMLNILFFQIYSSSGYYRHYSNFLIEHLINLKVSIKFLGSRYPSIALTNKGKNLLVAH